MSERLDAITFARAEEQIRQEREAFDQQKIHDRRWFNLKISTGIVSIILLLAIVPICLYIFINSSKMPDFVVKAASAALFGDVVGVIALVFKVVIGGSETKALAPVTKAIQDQT